MSSHDHPHRHHSHSHDHQQQRVHVNFRLSLPRPTYAHSVCLYGSWDGFTNPLVMEQDRRVSRTLWKGLYTRDGGLRMGGVYEYYFVIDNHRIIPDPASPGDEVMIDEHGRRYSRLQVPVLAPSNPLLSPNESRRGSAASAPAAAPHVVDGNSDHQRRAHARVMSDPTAARNLDFGYVPAGIEPVRRRGSGRGGMKTSAEMEMEQREMEQREMEQRGKREQREMREHRQQREQDARKKLSSLARGTSKLRRMGSKAMMRFVNPQQQSNTTTTSTHDTNPPPLPPPPPPPPPPDTHHDPADTTNASPPKRRRWLGGFTWPRSHPAQDAVYPSSPVPGTTSAASSTATTATRRSSKTPPAGPRPSPLLPPLRVPSSDINDEARHGRCAGSTADGSERMERLHTEGDDVGDIADDMAELFGYLEHAGSEERERVRGAGHNRERVFMGRVLCCGTLCEMVDWSAVHDG
ncbi:hypothetical protein EX30DRAFT_120382 [Ascodesmis nigricans]|uniref:AMP-activated protein kinase glycogen-binding domain-containing protein n=1 Tax=Ascodesmis nigricans TaxID=341454 RepID=A0A4S2MP95_9PEZI|nr:hypothetical protein EX30DRAFT_120382 [Ascodesmis nigricans]